MSALLIGLIIFWHAEVKQVFIRFWSLIDKTWREHLIPTPFLGLVIPRAEQQKGYGRALDTNAKERDKFRVIVLHFIPMLSKLFNLI